MTDRQTHKLPIYYAWFLLNRNGSLSVNSIYVVHKLKFYQLFRRSITVLGIKSRWEYLLGFLIKSTMRKAISSIPNILSHFVRVFFCQHQKWMELYQSANENQFCENHKQVSFFLLRVFLHLLYTSIISLPHPVCIFLNSQQCLAHSHNQ